MSNPNDEVKDSVSSDLDRRTMLRAALMVGGAAALTGVAATAHAATAPAAAPVQTAPPPAETEWARALTRVIVSQLPQAIAQAPDIRLTTTQVAELQRLFANTLLTNMGCTVNG